MFVQTLNNILKFLSSLKRLHYYKLKIATVLKVLTNMKTASFVREKRFI